MKHQYLLFLVLLLFEINSYGQWELDGNFTLNFDNETHLNHLTIDSISNPQNIWIIGPPNKAELTDPYSTPNVIITDTSKSYPINDTSTFIIRNTALGRGFEWPHTVWLQGMYYVDTDTLSDFGGIEFSPNNGHTWLDILNDTIVLDSSSNFSWSWARYGERPVLSGNSNGWKTFWVHLAELGHTYNVQFGDTVLYRFSFISDSLDFERDGLMFDDLHFEDFIEGIESPGFELFNSRCFPNPTSGELFIEVPIDNMSNVEVFIYDTSARTVYHNSDITDTQILVPTELYSEGLYYYKVIDTKYKRYSIGRFVKIK